MLSVAELIRFQEPSFIYSQQTDITRARTRQLTREICLEVQVYLFGQENSSRSSSRLTFVKIKKK